MSELAKALLAFQAHLPRITKASEAQYGKYADLADITQRVVPVLAEHGLVWTCWPDLDTSGETPQLVMRYRLIHAESGEEETGVYPLPSSTPQTMGGALTYARRYTLCAVTGVAAEDDDDDAEAAQKEALMDRDQRREHNALRRGAVTGKVPGTTRVRHVSEDLEARTWQNTAPKAGNGSADHAATTSTPAAGPSAADLPPEERPGSIEGHTDLTRQINIRLTAAGFRTKAERLNRLTEYTHRAIESTNDLSLAEGQDFLKLLDQEEVPAGG